MRACALCKLMAVNMLFTSLIYCLSRIGLFFVLAVLVIDSTKSPLEAKRKDRQPDQSRSKSTQRAPEDRYRRTAQDTGQTIEDAQLDRSQSRMSGMYTMIIGGDLAPSLGGRKILSQTKISE